MYESEKHNNLGIGTLDSLKDICKIISERTEALWPKSKEMQALALGAAIFEENKPYKIREFENLKFPTIENWEEYKKTTLFLICRFVQLINEDDPQFEDLSLEPVENIGIVTDFLSDPENEYVLLRIKNTFISASRTIKDKKLLGNLSKEYKLVYKNYAELSPVEKEEVDLKLRFIKKGALNIIVEKSPSPSVTHELFEKSFDVFKPKPTKTLTQRVWSIIKSLAD